MKKTLLDRLKDFAIRLYLGHGRVRHVLTPEDMIWSPTGPRPGTHRAPPMPKIAPPRSTWSPLLVGLGCKSAPVRCDSCDCPPIAKPGCHRNAPYVEEFVRFVVGTGGESPAGFLIFSGIVQPADPDAVEGVDVLTVKLDPCSGPWPPSDGWRTIEEPIDLTRRFDVVIDGRKHERRFCHEIAWDCVDFWRYSNDDRAYNNPLSKPATPGAYVRLYGVRGEDHEYFCWWNGERWSTGFATLQAARIFGPRSHASADQARLWRDVTVEDSFTKAR